mmetsp:Transcript_18706/g.52624  ORF Transcript_18706/g.52624 Transcript_18706/m.52624 type:complete len:157 (-) Transcript_18706:1044-1514(-)
MNVRILDALSQLDTEETLRNILSLPLDDAAPALRPPPEDEQVRNGHSSGNVPKGGVGSDAGGSMVPGDGAGVGSGDSSSAEGGGGEQGTGARLETYGLEGYQIWVTSGDVRPVMHIPFPFRHPHNNAFIDFWSFLHVAVPEKPWRRSKKKKKEKRT